MIHRRFSLAVGDDGLPASGRIVVFRPTAVADLDAVPAERSLLVQGFRPDHDALAAQGFAVAPECAPEGAGEFAAGVVFVARSRDETRALIAAASAAVAIGGAIWIDGQKTDGIDAVLREARARVAVSAPYAKSHGKCAAFVNPGPGAFGDWVARPTMPTPGFAALPGCFSADGIDPGSAALAAALPAKIKGRVADLGAGWGWLAAQALTHPGVTGVHLVEAEWAALQSARANLADERAQFHWADATTVTGLPRLDTVVMNPPFHRGRTGDPALGAAFIQAAARLLAPSGVLWMVANRHLPYEPTLQAKFGEVTEVAGTGAFKVFRAARPLTRLRDTAPGTVRSPRRPGG